MTAPSPDNLFRELLRNGDPEAFASLYDSVRPELLGIASRLAPNASCAEDLVQATFLGALESAPRFKRGFKEFDIYDLQPNETVLDLKVK